MWLLVIEFPTLTMEMFARNPVSLAPDALARRVALVSVVANVVLSVGNMIVGYLGRSTSVFAAGAEFGADVVAAALVYTGLKIASKPADHDHPYGHGRAETLTGLLVGIILVLAGIGICWHSLRNYSLQHAPPSVSAVWPLLIAMIFKSVMMTAKFRIGRRIRSMALVSDGWNDAVDILSGGAALIALGLTLYLPEKFLAADHFGGFAVGLIVVGIGLRVGRDTSLELMDTMPPPELMSAIRSAALRVEDAVGVEKCWARKTGFQYHVGLHLEVDSRMSVAESHGVAERVRHQIRREVPSVADVLVHVEPSPTRPTGPEEKPS